MTRYLRTHKYLNEASEIFSDPLNLAMLVRKVTIIEPEREAGCGEAFSLLVETSRRVLSERKSVVYSILRYDRKRKSLRLILAGDLVLALLGESPGVLVKGDEAYRLLLEASSAPGALCSIVVGEVNPDALPQQLKSILEDALRTRIVFPDAWVNRVIHGFKASSVLPGDEYSFRLDALDPAGMRYLITVPRWDQPNSGMLLLNAADALGFQLLAQESLRRPQLGEVDAETLKRLAFFTRYMAPCRGIIAEYGGMDEQKYLDTPPCIIEAYEGGVSLYERLKSGGLDANDSLLILHRFSGLAAVMGLLGYGLNTLRPSDIWLVEDKSEPTGHRFLLTGCSNVQRLDSPYRGLYRGLETIDPLTLVTGRLTWMSSMFTASSTALLVLLGKPVTPYLQLNLAILQTLHGVKAQLPGEPGLEEYVKNARGILEQLLKGEIDHREALRSLDKLVEEEFSRIIELLKNKIGAKTSEYLARTLSLNPDRRYGSPIEAFKALEEALLEDGYSGILALKT
ncbi:protein kinase [Desulfurococcus mucosus DSM 2162]|uniref:Protein kinase n=1 Tax=Desulfurococcus mucosus (strain ATCC 35584 / DSM 2162 / JCM 9187 / O7/1) TaxID=765177 RepID=E8R9N9_DESM0|nr:protein kinase [Desulfurococcus mucosus DSM 2162]